MELLTGVSKAPWPPASLPRRLPLSPEELSPPASPLAPGPQAVHAWRHPSFCRPSPRCSRCALSPTLRSKYPFYLTGLDESRSFSALKIQVSTYLLLEVPGFITACRLSPAAASRGYSLLRSQACRCGGISWCGEQASAVVVPRLSCPKTHGILPDQRWKPCPLPWQVDP